jgi:sugar phosphate permease
MAYSTQSWGAIIAPFIIGLIADRYFNAERILGVLHLLGAVLMYQMANAENFAVFYPYVLGYMIAYMPTLALVNSVSFNQMTNPAKEFSIRFAYSEPSDGSSPGLIYQLPFQVGHS